MFIKRKNAPGATNTESVQIDWLTQKRAVTTDTVIIPLLGRLVKVYPKEVILLWQDSKKEKMAAINAR